MTERDKIEAAIAALDAQRPALGDTVVDVAVAPLRDRLHALDGSPAPDVRLHQVSVLFVDVVASSALTRELGNEDAGELIREALARFAADVQARGGRVLRFQGDGLKAAFGVDAVREDAAASAVRAGLAVLASTRALAKSRAAVLAGRGFDVRAGIATGDAVLGGGIEAANSVTGNVVHLAARMEASAPTGSLRITADTYAEVRGLFDVVQDAPLAVKGEAQALRTYLVRGELDPGATQARRGVEGVVAPLIGRAIQLAHLRGTLASVRAGEGLRVIAVLGEAGIGKSRLAREFTVETMTAATAWLVAGARPDSVLRPYAVIRDLLARRYGVTDGDDLATMQEKLVAGIAGDLGRREGTDAELLARLVGFDVPLTPQAEAVASDPRALRARGESALLAWLGKACGNEAAVLLLDDLHWADAASLDTIASLLSRATHLRLLVLALARPTLAEDHAAWLASLPGVERIELRELDGGQSDDLASALLARMPDVPAPLHALLVERASGNPFYMEEMLKVLLDDAVIVPAEGAHGEVWHVDAARLTHLRLPVTLTGVLQARLAALPAPARRSSEAAAIVGPVFWDQAVAVVQPGALGELDRLVTSGISRMHATSAFVDAREFAFRHHLLYQVAYDMVPKAARLRGHALAATWFAARVSERSGEHHAITAEHFSRAGNHAEAAIHFERAAKAAEGRFANADALGYLARALEEASPDDAVARWRLLESRESLLDRLGRREEQDAAIDELTRVAEALGDDARRADVKFMRALLADRRGNYALALESAIAAIPLAESAGAWRTAARAYAERAYALAQVDQPEEGRAWVRKGIECAERAGETLVRAQLLAVCAHVEHEAGNTAEAITVLRQAIDLARANGHLRLVGLLAGNLGHLYESVGQYDRDLPLHEEALSILRQVGDRNGEVMCLCSLAITWARKGDTERALAFVDESALLAQGNQDPYRVAIARRIEARIRIRRGELALAGKCAAEAQGLFEERGLLPDALEAQSRRAEVALRTGDLAGARKHMEAILAHDVPYGPLGTSPHLGVAYNCYRVLERLEDPRAQPVIEAAYAQLCRLRDGLKDPELQRSYMDNIDVHRDIAKAARRLAAAP